jgi:septal ring-binding cell division protein DamX
VNLVADKALLAAFAENTHTVKLSHVQAAVRESEFSNRRKRPTPRWIGSVALLAAGVAVGAGAYWWLGSPPRPSGTASTEALSTKAPAASPSAPDSTATPAAPDAASAATNTPVGEATAGFRATSDTDAQSGSLRRTEDPHTSTKPFAESVADRMAATDRWLAAPSGREFTIQLALAAEDQEELSRYLNHLGKFIESQEVFVYRTRVNDKSHLGVAYGSFPTRQAAQSALERLPETIRGDRPYIRSASGIRREAQRSP